MKSSTVRARHYLVNYIVFGALAVLVVALVLGAAFLGPLASARAQGPDFVSGEQKIAAFDDVRVGPNETWDNVVVFAGDAVIEGMVRDRVVVVGGDLVVRAGAQVGQPGDADRATLICVLGNVSADPGAAVQGRTVDVAARA
ncbi:MAG: hypothetical protein H5T84_09090, partial [Thermoleophilia bacterium]|nr:hypothetical protein [Thermoleophilia bacterium]